MKKLTTLAIALCTILTACGSPATPASSAAAVSSVAASSVDEAPSSDAVMPEEQGLTQEYMDNLWEGKTILTDEPVVDIFQNSNAWNNTQVISTRDYVIFVDEAANTATTLTFFEDAKDPSCDCAYTVYAENSEKFYVDVVGVEKSGETWLTQTEEQDTVDRVFEKEFTVSAEPLMLARKAYDALLDVGKGTIMAGNDGSIGYLYQDNKSFINIKADGTYTATVFETPVEVSDELDIARICSADFGNAFADTLVFWTGKNYINDKGTAITA